jgi:hypothetical protein
LKPYPILKLCVPHLLRKYDRSVENPFLENTSKIVCKLEEIFAKFEPWANCAPGEEALRRRGVPLIPSVVPTTRSL